jgi:hypothetical protein
MGKDGNFNMLMRPFDLLDRNIISASCHMHIYRRINALSNQMQVVGKDADAIIAVRAGSITSALVSLMACLDRHYPQFPDRSSIGGLIHRLKTPDYRNCFVPYHGSDAAYDAAHKALNEAFDQFRSTDDFLNANELRNNDVAHILDKDTPTVTYDCLENVFHSVRDMCDLAFATLGCARPTNKSYEANHEATADWFIKTYVKGMQS